MNDLSQLLSPGMDNALTHDLSVVTLHKLKSKKTKETWIEKLKKGSNYQASPDKIA
jgi:hypothetical protein